jgi:hypothetical protein
VGAIKAEELANGNIGLEITYGGKESPFGGVDTSAPPAYIDPACFTNCDGFIIVDNKLVAVSVNSAPVPTLWNGTAGVLLIGFGNFYSTKWGTLNYALGYTAVAVTGVTTGVEYTFYMTAWSPASLSTIWNDTLVFTIFDTATPATTASLTLDLLTSGSAPSSNGTGAIVNITSISNFGIAAVNSIYIPGSIASITISGGTNYVVGDNYYVSQSTALGVNVTGQIVVDSIGAGGAITGFHIVSNSYTTYWGYPQPTHVLNFAGTGYVVGPATLSYTPVVNVVLKISGPNGINTYTVTVGQFTYSTASVTGSGANGQIDTLNPDGTIASLTVFDSGGGISSFTGDHGGASYIAGGSYYILQQASNCSTAALAAANGAAQIQVISVGGGGGILDWNFISSGSPSAGYVAGSYGSSASNLTLAPVPITTMIGSSAADILTNMAADINGTATFTGAATSADPNVTATVNSGLGALVFTAYTGGVIGNSITVQDLSYVVGGTYYYYFPARSPENLTGGTDSSGSTLSTTLSPKASIASVGGVLYIANIGPSIIKYGGPGAFAISTLYQGVRILRKFAGSLIGLAKIDAPGIVDTAQDMMFLWSAANALDEWNPTNISGNVTGAGFAQLADIGDYLTGLVVSNGTAFIIRSQGISYATATGNATSPFNFAHIGLGDEGEGSQTTSLICQYNQTGAFVGNSDIYQVSNSISSIGQKIKPSFFALIEGSQGFLSAASCAVYAGQDIVVLFCFQLDTVSFLFNALNKTWTQLTIRNQAGGQTLNSFSGVFANSNVSESADIQDSNQLVQAQQQTTVSSGIIAPTFWKLVDGVPGPASINVFDPTVTFPVEEISFGRDITIDGLYVSLLGVLTGACSLNFSFNGITFGSLALASGSLNMTTPTEFQVFPSSVTTSGAFTVHSPQLTVTIPSFTNADSAKVYIVKIAEFASYDPKQRPV